MESDQDTFDTWFSSGQWPFATLRYPDSSDFDTFYPTSVMETGADILFFWVARMLMLGLYVTGEVPFKKVYLHGLVQDAKGKKMSKSKGNVISPLELSEEYGTDALRMGLVVGNTPGTNMNLDPLKIGAYKKFANKLWNIARFVLENTDDLTAPLDVRIIAQGTYPGHEAHLAYLTELDQVTRDITQELDLYHIHLAAEKLYHYVWDTFAAIIIENMKVDLKSDDVQVRAGAQSVLRELLRTSLTLLHPFMPFVTEEIWSSLPETKNLLIVEPWPGK